MSDLESSTSPLQEPPPGNQSPPVSQVNLTLHQPDGSQTRILIEITNLPAGVPAAPDSETKIHQLQEGETIQVGPLSIAVSLPPVLEGVREASALPHPISKPAASPGIFQRLSTKARAWPYSLETTLFALSIIIYLAVRLVGLTDFPIFFFSDEAIQTLLASDFVQENFKNAAGEFLPTYFYNYDKYSLGTTVYLQTLPYILFGKSAFVSRATSVLVTLLAAVSVGLILRDIFKLPYWWSATLILSTVPAWFLHSRTAFESVTMVSFYAAALYFYLLYRYKAPKHLFAALVLFALAFYSYSPGQIVVVLTGILLLLSDLRYHWENRRTGLLGLGLLVLLTLPYIRFRLGHPTAVEDHLVLLNSYWVQPISIQEKLNHFLGEYTYGLSPGYWFIPNGRDLVRHLMKDYGHLHRASLIFAAIGFFVLLVNFRSSAHRAVLIAWFAAPVGAAMVQIAITRALVMVVPAALQISLGVITCLIWLEKKRLSRRLMSVGLFGILAALNVWMITDALSNGPTWYPDYGLNGMQYGGEQIFRAIKQYKADYPEKELIVSPSWANGTDYLARFFMGDPLPVRLGSIDEYFLNHLDLDKNKVFVMIPDEYERVMTSEKFKDMQVHQTLPYPDGKPGFYFVTLGYVDDIDEILVHEQDLRRQLQQAEVEFGGQPAQVRYSLLDMGEITELWDGHPQSVTRTFEANPYVIEITLSEPVKMNGLSLIIGDTKVEVKAKLYETAGADPAEYIYNLEGSVQNPQVTLDFPEERSVAILYLEVRDLQQGEPGHVHIWEMTFH